MVSCCDRCACVRSFMQGGCPLPPGGRCRVSAGGVCGCRVGRTLCVLGGLGFWAAGAGRGHGWFSSGSSVRSVRHDLVPAVAGGVWGWWEQAAGAGAGVACSLIGFRYAKYNRRMTEVASSPAAGGGQGRCARCSGPIGQRASGGRGRPRKYCSASCRNGSYLASLRAARDELATLRRGVAAVVPVVAGDRSGRSVREV